MKSNTEQLKIAEKYLGESCPKCCSMKNNCCCFFVSKIFKDAGNKNLFYNGVTVTYCPNAIKWCKTNLAQIPPYLAMPSDIIFFDWELNGVPNHIGFVDHRIDDTQIATLEANTTSAYKVARRVRDAKYIQGIFRPHFKGSFDTSKALTIDGQFGYHSVAMLQKALGVTVDGILGKATIKKLQAKVGVTQDGSWGNATSKGIQKFLKAQGCYSGAIDGCFYIGSVKALQTWINKAVGKTSSAVVTPPVASVTPPVTTVTPTASKYKVIDVSVWQGTIDWAKVKADGVVGAIIRYADGKTLDSKFDYNMKQAKANGIHVGSYIFSRAKTKAEAEAEATRLYNACKPYAPDLPLYIDLEVASLSKYANTVAQAFLNKMKALGGKGGVYANLNWWNNYLGDTAKKYSTYPFWIAQYNSKVTHKTPSLFGMWQYSSSGSVKGISGKVDMDWLYVRYWDNAPKAPTPTTPTPTPTTTPTKTDGTYTGTLPSLSLVKSTSQVIADALLFAKWIVNDNRFGYGRKGGAKYQGTKEYSITHSGGCHFCGSNAHKISKAKAAGLKNPEEWEYTFVCNTLVHACFAHAGVPSMMSSKGHAWWTKNYKNSSYWTEIKKPSKITDLQPGDVLGSESHYALYYGNGKIAEATSQGDASASKDKWNKTINIGNGANWFKSVNHVFRLTKSVNTTALIKYGEVSYRVKLVQQFLNWYNGKTVCTVDGIFGDGTLKYVKAFQTAQKITSDGIVGNTTIAKMKSAKKSITTAPTAPTAPTSTKTWQEKCNEWAIKTADSKKYRYKTWTGANERTHQCPICHPVPTIPTVAVKYGAEGNAVKVLQSFLNWCIGTKLTVDGKYGNATKEAVKKFQKSVKIDADGIYGSKSIAKAKTMNGWNCIGAAFAVWHHGNGGAFKSNCNCGVIGNGTGEKILQAKTDAEAEKIATKNVGVKVKVIRNGGKAIPLSMLKKGDILMLFKGSVYYHTVYYMGNGKIYDSTSGRSQNIKANVGLSSYAKGNIKVAVRYGG